jgi:hypothetical protein
MADDRAQRNRERFPRFSAWLEREIRVFDAGAKVRWVVLVQQEVEGQVTGQCLLRGEKIMFKSCKI